MLPETRRFTKIVFIAIYILFGAILLYLLFFNTGLAIVEEVPVGTGIKHIYIENQSTRTILNISISYRAPGTTNIINITDLNKLKSGKRHEIIYSFPEEFEAVDIIASAPFHQTIIRPISLRFGETGLRYNFKTPNRIFVNNQFTLVFEVCNDSNERVTTLVEESYDEGSFEQSSITKSVTLEANSCRKLEYKLTPLKVGETTIYFKSKVQNISDKRDITITVEE